MTAARHAGPAGREEAFRWPVRVYWEDTDAAGIVFYANYLKFFERARTEWLRSLGFEQEALRAEAGLGFVVTDTALATARRPGSTTCSRSRSRSATSAWRA